LQFANAQNGASDLGKFWSFTDSLDQLRGENFAETFPEWYRILKPTQNSN
jgi:hypothetical protein